MKIGIITQPLHSNYGGLLQNYALQQVLTRMGHEVITLDQDFHNPSILRIHLGCLKTLFLKTLGKGKNRNYPFYVSKKHISYIRKNTDYFIKKYIIRTSILNTIEDFRTYTRENKLDALIVGSDQVWRPKYNKNVFCSFLDFTVGIDVRRMAYAASFGVDSWEFTPKETKQSKDLIKLFDYVSVREKSGINLCNKYLDCKAEHVLDPTMLLEKEDYIKLVENEREEKRPGTLFTYILDQSEKKQRIINEVVQSLSLRCFCSMPHKTITKKSLKDIDSCIFPPVTQWLRSFMDAKFVICDSFHGAVFSIIFNKPFLIIGNESRGMTRFTSLLETFDLNNRIITEDTLNFSVVHQKIDWVKVNSIRIILKEKSLLFLKQIDQ